VIAAASARPFVRAAAAAGYDIIAADVFSDEDTRRDAFQAIQLGYGDGGFLEEDIVEKLIPRLHHEGLLGFAYGSGFETQPDLLDEIAQICPLLGNSPDVVARIKSPQHFFGQLAALGIPFPETQVTLPQPLAGWLAKRVGGSGGTHVVAAQSAGPDTYFQKRCAGRPVCLLFLANTEDVLPVGWHAQILAPTLQMPYRYGGAFSQVELDPVVRTAMLDAARTLTQAFGLRGLNSLDCLVDGQSWWVLEVNPRLSASFGLYDTPTRGARLFQAHLDACGGVLNLQLPPEPAQAHLIYYAVNSVTIPSGFVWPEWVADVPLEETHISAGEPVCTVMASGENEAEAVTQARQRVEQLNDILSNLPE
jgi:predicted ATP-grasp superfamily ATP-dependent carboligase